MLNVLDIFSGIGGFSIGLEAVGMKTVAFCEIDPFCRKILTRHWPSVPIFSDITTIDKKDLKTLPRIDIIAGGFPCQDISVAGKQKGIAAKRSGLWKEFARLINEVRPKYTIIENVANLRSKGLISVLQDLWEIGYNAEWHCIPASAFGAPHRRDRIWIIAYPSCISKVGLSIGKEETESTFGDSCKNASDPDCKRCEHREYNQQGRCLPGNKNRKYTQTQQEWDIGESWTSQICKILPDTDQQGLQGCRGFEEISSICSQEQIGMYYCRRGIKQWGEEPLEVARLKDERLNPDWVEWLMGYPISWTDGGSRMQRLQSLGNAVVPLIPEFLGKVVVDHCKQL
jgi:DNA (cytosine-5)-methyltransferase 1